MTEVTLCAHGNPKPPGKQNFFVCLVESLVAAQELFPNSYRCFSTLVPMLINISRRASLLSRAPDHIARPFGVG